MKRLMQIFLGLLLFMPCAYAEESLYSQADFSGVQAVLNENGAEFDLQAFFESLVSGDAETDPGMIFEKLRSLFHELTAGLKDHAVKIVLPVLLWAVVFNLLPDAHAGRRKYALFAALLYLNLSLFRMLFEVFSLARNAAKMIAAITEQLMPVLVSLLALTGGTRSAALITPMGAVASGLLSNILSHAALSLAGLLAVLSSVNAIGGMKLKRMEAFVKSFLKLLLSAVVGGYIAMMSTGGLISGAYDGALLKGARLAADRLLPIVGGEISGTMDSLASGAQLIRSAVGITGLAALLFAVLRPMMLCLLCRWGLVFFAAVLEPIADDDMLKLMESFSGVFSSMLAILAAGLSLGIILIGAVQVSLCFRCG